MIKERLSKRNDPIRQREKRWGKKMNRDSGTSRTTSRWRWERGSRKIFAEMIDIALNVGKDINLKIQGQQILSKVNMKKTIPKHIIAKLLRTKIKKNSWKQSEKKWQITYRRTTTWMSTNFSSEKMEARRQGGLKWSSKKDLTGFWFKMAM